ncbi:MAG: hypothetical protein HUU23_00660 [Caldilineales bacterium]|nr:hypothetical protein [Caldilineales bacterium]
MQFVVSTHSRLLRIDLDAHWRITDMAVLADGPHYGIALAPQPLPGIIAKSNTCDLTAYDLSQDANRAQMPVPHTNNDHIHQIAFARDGLYIANTFYNSLTYQTLDGSIRHEYAFNGHRTDINHVNSVYPCGDLVLVLLHNRSQPSQIAVLEHDLARGFAAREMIRLPHNGCHNVFVDQRYLYYCASGVGHFVVVDLRKKQIKLDLPFAGHTKGLSVTEDHIVFGLSEHAKREARLTSRGQLVVVDRCRLAICSMIDLNEQGAVGNVNEIRCLSEPELAHTGHYEHARALGSFVVRPPHSLAASLARLTARIQRRLTARARG